MRKALWWGRVGVLSIGYSQSTCFGLLLLKETPRVFDANLNHPPKRTTRKVSGQCGTFGVLGILAMVSFPLLPPWSQALCR